MSPFSPSSLLIVEEDPIQAAALRGYLRERGYRCDLATTPDHALERCRFSLYDLALVNSVYRGDHTSGSRLVYRLHRLHLLPSLLITGARDPPPIAAAGVLRKPFTGRQCLRMIRDQLRLASRL